jgi:hypothetical protein
MICLGENLRETQEIIETIVMREATGMRGSMRVIETEGTGHLLRALRLRGSRIVVRFH